MIVMALLILAYVNIITAEHTIVLGFRFNQKSWLKLAIREWRLEGGGGGKGVLHV